jgi:hypothetical protein
MLLVYIYCYLKSVLRYKFLIFDINHMNNLYLFEQGCEDPWLLFEAKRGPQAKKFWKHWIRCLYAIAKPTSIYEHVEF